jgi:TorA maturation chaperone TorD
MEIADLMSQETARGDSFKHLAACYQQPRKELVDNIKKLRHHLATVCPEAALHVEKMIDEFEITDTLEPLAVDYARLFVGPYELLAPPYGSVYLDGERQVMGKSTLEVRDKYRKAGLDISSDFRDPPDHISAELEFIYFLVFKEVEALRNSDIETTLNFLEKQRDFLRAHLGVWVFDFAESIEEKAETNFYKNLARATKAFIGQYLDELSDLFETEAPSEPSMSVAN